MTISPVERGKKSENRWRLWRFHLAEPLILFLVLFFPGYIGSATADALPDFSDPLFLLQYLMIAIPQILLILIIISKKGEESFAQYGISSFSLSSLLSALPISLVLLASSFLMALPFAFFGEGESILLPGPWKVGAIAMAPFIIIINLITGYREELFFRAYLLHEIGGRGKERFGGREIFFTSLLFALGHAYQGIQGLGTTFLLSVLLGLRFRAKRNIHEIALAHGIYNSIALFLVFLASSRSL